MDKLLFEREMNRAKTMASIENNDYWRGYQRGLRRRYHGERFGTDEEHAKWLSLAQDADPARAERGRGYRDGYTGLSTLLCLRCGHGTMPCPHCEQVGPWVPRTPSRPMVCPCCKSPYWDREKRTDQTAK